MKSDRKDAALLRFEVRVTDHLFFEVGQEVVLELDRQRTLEKQRGLCESCRFDKRQTGV